MSNICVGCGLCCDGSMYSVVDVVPDDSVDILADSGIELTTEDGRTFFRQPCHVFKSGCCSVYDNRPGICRRYRCHLLRRYEQGVVTDDDAIALIARTVDTGKRVRSALADFLGSHESRSLKELFRLVLSRLDAEPDPAAARRDHAAMLMSVVGLRAILKREFELPKPDGDSQSVDDGSTSGTQEIADVGMPFLDAVRK